MATIANVHFCRQTKDHVVSNVQKYFDGAPCTVMKELEAFFRDVKRRCKFDHRIWDADSLAAKYIMWIAEMWRDRDADRLDFKCISPVIEDHVDVAYRYFVVCNGAFGSSFEPTVCFEEVMS